MVNGEWFELKTNLTINTNHLLFTIHQFTSFLWQKNH